MHREMEAVEELEKLKDSMDAIDIEKALAKARSMDLMQIEAASSLDKHSTSRKYDETAVLAIGSFTK